MNINGTHLITIIDHAPNHFNNIGTVIMIGLWEILELVKKLLGNGPIKQDPSVCHLWF
jgi:hypothetical protein